jgi:hypothetical protein
MAEAELPAVLTQFVRSPEDGELSMRDFPP